MKLYKGDKVEDYLYIKFLQLQRKFPEGQAQI